MAQRAYSIGPLGFREALPPSHRQALVCLADCLSPLWVIRVDLDGAPARPL